jgi:cytochrome c peroxidase
MGSTLSEVTRKLIAEKEYQDLFNSAFSNGVTTDNLGKALASFERTILRGDSVVDRFRKKGDHDALTPAERHGLWLYESKARCWRCHAGSNFTDEAFHNTGVSWGKEPPDLGLFSISKKEGDQGKFKTPTLRGVSLTAPYMHDGSLKTLREVIEFYNRGGGANKFFDPTMAPLDLSNDEIDALVAFLKAL